MNNVQALKVGNRGAREGEQSRYRGATTLLRNSRMATPAESMIGDEGMIADSYMQYHNESVLKKYQERLKVGTLKESSKL